MVRKIIHPEQQKTLSVKLDILSTGSPSVKQRMTQEICHPWDLSTHVEDISDNQDQQ